MEEIKKYIAELEAALASYKQTLAVSQDTQERLLHTIDSLKEEIVDLKLEMLEIMNDDGDAHR